jgi:hypothetical protein
MANFHFMDTGNSTFNPSMFRVSSNNGFYPGSTLTPVSSIEFHPGVMGLGMGGSFSAPSMGGGGSMFGGGGSMFGGGGSMFGGNDSSFGLRHGMDPRNDMFVDQRPRIVASPNSQYYNGSAGGGGGSSSPNGTRAVIDHAPHTIIYDRWGNPTAEVHKRVTLVDRHTGSCSPYYPTAADLLNHRAGLKSVPASPQYGQSGINAGRAIIGYRPNGQPLYRI